jgi:hypothetical protein
MQGPPPASAAVPDKVIHDGPTTSATSRFYPDGWP